MNAPRALAVPAFRGGSNAAHLPVMANRSSTRENMFAAARMIAQTQFFVESRLAVARGSTLDQNALASCKTLAIVDPATIYTVLVLAT